MLSIPFSHTPAASDDPESLAQFARAKAQAEIARFCQSLETEKIPQTIVLLHKTNYEQSLLPNKIFRRQIYAMALRLGWLGKWQVVPLDYYRQNVRGYVSEQANRLIQRISAQYPNQRLWVEYFKDDPILFTSICGTRVDLAVWTENPDLYLRLQQRQSQQ